MFNNNRIENLAQNSESNGKHELSSGWNIQTSFDNYNTYRSEIEDCFTLNENDANLATVYEYANMADQARGFNLLLSKASRAKLDTAREMMNVMRTYSSHNVQAVGMEAQLQQSEKQMIQALDKSLIDIGTTQAGYNGYIKHVDMARSIVSY